MVNIRDLIVFESTFRLAAEIWDLEKLDSPDSNRISVSTLPFNYYREVALFLVDEDYCKKGQ